MPKIPRLGQLREKERFPIEDEEKRCIEVTCPTCKSVGYGLPASVVRCPNCSTICRVPLIGKAIDA